MRRIGTAAAALVLTAGLPALAGPDHDHHAEVKHLTVDEVLPEYSLPKVWYGAEAPKMEIAEFVKGAPVTDFEPGRVYVVEFWATWCGPCIAAFPHLTELQKQYDDQVTFVGVNIWERFEGAAERSEQVNAFVEKQGEKMGYTVAIENGSQMAENWMRAAGRNGIPSAFIVDQHGKIAWMGHPMSMDEPLAAVVNGHWNASEAKKEAAAAHATETLFTTAITDLRSGNDARAFKIIQSLAAHEMADDPSSLNRMAMGIMTAGEVDDDDAKLALSMATRANELTDFGVFYMLDTLAQAYHANGQNDKAIATQQKAIELIKAQRDAQELSEAGRKRYEQTIQSYTETLESFQEG